VEEELHNLMSKVKIGELDSKKFSKDVILVCNRKIYIRDCQTLKDQIFTMCIVTLLQDNREQGVREVFFFFNNRIIIKSSKHNLGTHEVYKRNA